jgi:hypothetical protein
MAPGVSPMISASDLRRITDADALPRGLSRLLVALWYESRGDWERAHVLAQETAGTAGAWVHAYLHRREGDLSNAAYWYQRAGRPAGSGSLDDEWLVIAGTLLAHHAEASQ